MSMVYESIPSRRLVTQNLLVSAARFEQHPQMEWTAIQDLSAFIDLYCLYDRVLVLGRGTATMLVEWESDFFGLLEQEHFVQVGTPREVDYSEIIRAASQHLITYLYSQEVVLGEDEARKYRELVLTSFNATSYYYSLLSEPDSKPEIHEVSRWLRETMTTSGLVEQLRAGGRSAIFLARTFLYLAYADVSRYAFSPDSVRTSVLNQVLNQEEQFRGRLLRTLQDSWQSQLGDGMLLSRVSPFSAIVLARAGKKKNRIVPEMQRLRQELEPDRKKLQDLEDRALRGKNLADRQDATILLNKAFDQISKSFGAPGILRVASRFPLNFGGVVEAVAKIVDEPENLTSWAKFLLTLPVEVPRAVAAHQTLVNTHHLIGSDDLPGVESLRAAIRNLFDVS